MKYEDREQLYKYLINDYGFKVIEEGYSPKIFGNFYDILAGKDILFKYVNDRSIISIEVSKDMAEPEWYYISLFKTLLYKEATVDSVDIEKENSFIKNEIDKIAELFNDANYPTTQKSLIKIRDQDFKKSFPGW